MKVIIILCNCFSDKQSSLRSKVQCRARDLLLPRLISGELDVSDLAVDTGGLDIT